MNYKVSIRTSINLHASVDPIVSLVDPNLDILVRYTCLSCMALIIRDAAFLALARASRQVLLDLYTLYSSYIPWLRVTEKRISKGLCPIIHGTKCKNLSLDIDGYKLVVSVDCDEITYKCILEVK